MYRVVAYKGYYIGTMAQDVGDQRLVGHGHICVDFPRSVETAKPLERVISAASYRDAEGAMQAAENQARHIIDGLEPNWSPFTAPGHSWHRSR